MASSGDYNFNLSSYKIITGAMRLLSAIQSGEIPPAEEYEDAQDALNGLMMHFQASGIHVWAQIDATLFLQPGQRTYYIGQGTTDHCCLSSDWAQTYLTNAALAGSTALAVGSTLGIAIGDQIGIVVDAVAGSASHYHWTVVTGVAGPTTLTVAAPLPVQAASGRRVIAYTVDLVRPLKVPASRRLTYAGNLGVPTRIETPLAIYSRIDYAAQTNKDSPGEVTGFFYDPQLGQGVFHTWPTPANADHAVMFTAQRPLQDFVSQRDNADLPVEWISCLRYNLAVELAPEYDVPAERFQMIKAIAADKFASCAAWDREPESIYFGLQQYPDTRNG